MMNFILPALAALITVGTIWGSRGPNIPWGLIATVKSSWPPEIPLASNTSCSMETTGGERNSYCTSHSSPSFPLSLPPSLSSFLPPSLLSTPPNPPLLPLLPLHLLSVHSPLPHPHIPPSSPSLTSFLALPDLISPSLPPLHLSQSLSHLFHPSPTHPSPLTPHTLTFS